MRLENGTRGRTGGELDVFSTIEEAQPAHEDHRLPGVPVVPSHHRVAPPEVRWLVYLLRRLPMGRLDVHGVCEEDERGGVIEAGRQSGLFRATRAAILDGPRERRWLFAPDKWGVCGTRGALRALVAVHYSLQVSGIVGACRCEAVHKPVRVSPPPATVHQAGRLP